jgi:TonB family protein
MTALESWIAVYLLNSIWQLPLIFAAAWIAARMARPIGPRTEHRIWVLALLVETILPACQVDLISLLRRIWAWLVSGLGSGTAGGQTRVILGYGSASGTGLLRLSPHLITAILVVYGCILAYFAARLAWGLWKTSQMLRQASPVSGDGATGRLEANFYRLSGELSPVYFAESSLVASPVTIGLRRRVLLLPPSFLERVGAADLDTVLAHESAHMRRRDFAKNLVYGCLSLPVAYHPLLWLTSARVAETREMVWDEIAANALAGKEPYARSLLRLASMLTEPMSAKTLHAIGIFDANIFERRIMNLAQKRIEIPTVQRFAIAVACAVIAVTTCASALALRVDVTAPTAQNEHPNPKSVHVKAESMKIVTNAYPVYPPAAKAARIQGSVILDATIGKDGVPEHLAIQKGPRELQQSALDAVRQWRWQPYLLNGEPIEVQTTVTVVYTLATK